MTSLPGSHGPPPDNNPVLSAYESFVRDTPLVTRYTLTTLTLSYMLSFFLNPSMALSNAVLWSIQRLELYRIVLSPLVCESGLTLIFAYMSFVDQGRRLEHSMGSAAFVALLLTLGGMANVAFLILMVVLYGLTGSQVFLIYPCYGIWVVLLGIIAVECSSAPPGTQRRIFSWEFEAKYYPLVVLGFFTLLGGLRVGEGIGMAIGYAYGYGYLDQIKIRSSTCRAWEDGCLRNFAQKPGWVVGTAATGADAWIPLNDPGGRQRQDEGGGWSPASFFQGSRTDTQGGSAGSAPGVSAPGRPVLPQETATEVFAGSGQSLGGSGSGGRGSASRRSGVPSEARNSAMLAAAERRAAKAETTENEVKQDR
uniref:Derlin n=1 Tax=Odontella aurita TaxID=265563 RepID=A0A7S4NJ43_9STRA|mmetsp:Transcript_861/g.2470  ORF Transcript_861/g.2470 Transcript_861/m.2470 type:complete len:366 (+) Transcript_861:140-1237(+)